MKSKKNKMSKNFLKESNILNIPHTITNIDFVVLALSIFVIYTFSQRYFELVFRTKFWQVAIVFIALFFLFLKYKSIKKALLNLTMLDIFWIIAFITILLYIKAVGISDYLLELFMYTSCVCFLILTKVSVEKFQIPLNIIKIVSLIYALGTIFQYLFTDFFNSIMFSLSVSSVQERVITLIKDNYYPGLSFAQPAIAAGYMVLGLGVTLIFKCRNKRNLIYSIGNIVCIFLLLIGIILTGKRSILIWSIVALLVTYYISSTGKEKHKRLFNIIRFVIIIIGVLLLISHLLPEAAFLSRITGTINGLISGRDVTSGRINLYKHAWQLFLQKPVFGIGWDQFRIVTSNLFTRDLNVHNVYLQLLCETGIVGFSLLVTPLLYIYLKTYRLLKWLLGEPEYNSSLWKVGISISIYFQTFFLLYCLTENPFYNLVYMFMYFFMIAIPNSFLIINRGNLRNGSWDFIKNVKKNR